MTAIHLTLCVIVGALFSISMQLYYHLPRIAKAIEDINRPKG